MKKLLDETTDDLTRTLLVAGLEHRPPAGNKAQVIIALGAGGALGLFSSNALAWLGTTTGKVTMFGVAMGMAGAVYATVSPGVSPLARRVDPVGLSLSSSTQRLAAASEDAVVRDAVVRDAVVRDAVVPKAVIRGALASESAASESASAEPLADVGSVRAADVQAPARAARGERRLAKIVSPKRSEPRRNGPLSAVQAPPAVGALEVDTLGANAPPTEAQRQADARWGMAAEAGGLDTLGAATPSLDSEVRLVDDMHWAVRRNDREALGRFLEAYRASFPDGQLKKEVAEFAARLERPAR